MSRVIAIAALIYIAFHYLQLMDMTLPVKYSFTVYAVLALYVFHFLIVLLVPNLFEKWIKEVRTLTLLTQLSTFTLLVCTRIQQELNGNSKELILSADAVLVLTASFLITFIAIKLSDFRVKFQNKEVEEWNSISEPPARIDHVETKLTQVDTKIININDRKPYSGAGTTFQE